MGISLGAVFMGAMTYIGNGPNFMVRAIAEKSGVKMPSFFGYMVYSCLILLPLFALMVWLYLVVSVLVQNRDVSESGVRRAVIGRRRLRATHALTCWPSHLHRVARDDHFARPARRVLSSGLPRRSHRHRYRVRLRRHIPARAVPGPGRDAGRAGGDRSVRAGDLTPFWRTLADGQHMTIVHAAREELNFALDGLRPAAGQPVRHAACRRFLQRGVSVVVRLGGDASFSNARPAKGEQRTDWRRRPLTAEQIDYALEDVRYLLPLHDALQRRLEAIGPARVAGRRDGPLAARCARCARAAALAASVGHRQPVAAEPGDRPRAVACGGRPRPSGATCRRGACCATI